MTGSSMVEPSLMRPSIVGRSRPVIIRWFPARGNRHAGDSPGATRRRPHESLGRGAGLRQETDMPVAKTDWWDSIGVWCRRTGLNCRPRPSPHLGFRRRPAGRSWAGPSLHLGPLPACRCHPSGLYTFPDHIRAWLGIGMGRIGPLAFPDFGRFSAGRFRPARQVSLPRARSTTELRRHD